MNFFNEILDKVNPGDHELGRDKTRETTTGKERGKLGFLHGETLDNGSSHIPGFEGQVGVFDGKVGKGFSGQLLQGEGFVGKHKDEDGKKEFGLEGHGKVLGLGQKTKKLKGLTGQSVSGDVEVLSGNGGVKFNKNKGLSVGAQVNLVQVRGQIGNEKKNFVRGGFSVGEGVGLRVGWGKNEDGDRQFSLGGDALFLTGDIGVCPKKVVENTKKRAKKVQKLGKKGLKQVQKLGKKGLDSFKDLLDNGI